MEGFIKQNDYCVQCTGAAWFKMFVIFCVKTALLFLLCGKLLEKAATRSCE
jgi:hypothetical protein